MLAMLFTLGLGGHDYLAHQGFMGIQEFYLLHLGIPAFLIVMAAVRPLIQRNASVDVHQVGYSDRAHGPEATGRRLNGEA